MTSVQAIYQNGVLIPQETPPEEFVEGESYELIVVENNGHRNGAARNGSTPEAEKARKKTPYEIVKEIAELSSGNDPFPDKTHDEVLYGDVYRPHGA